MDLPTQALALGYLSLAWGFGTILGELPAHMPCFYLACGRLLILQLQAFSYISITAHNLQCSVVFV